MLALPVGPIGREEAALAAWPHAIGPCLHLERDVAAALQRMLFSETSGHWIDGRLFEFDPGVDGEALVIQAHPYLGAGPQPWARVRVRVSVEVLDGIL